jgi:Immunity protein 35
MIDFEEANKIAKKHISDECGLIEKYTIKKPYSWYFSVQSKKFIETGNFLDMTIGSGGFLVERESGHVLEFGSAYPPETWLENYEKGFKYNTYNLTILQVKNLSTTIEALLKLDIQYVIPELENGVECL